jgi:hypothetical protein
MEASAIISDLYNSKEVNEAINKMEPDHLRDELKSEMFLALCELPPERIIKMHEGGWIKFYLVRMMLNMVKSKSSAFYKKFRKVFCELPEIKVEDTVIDYSIEDLEKAMKEMYWHERDMLMTYVLFDRNSTAVSRNSGIPRRTVDYTVNLAKKKIYNKLKKPRSMKIEVTKTLVFETTQPLDADQIVDLINDYDRIIERKIRDSKATDNSYLSEIKPARIKKTTW